MLTVRQSQIDRLKAEGIADLATAVADFKKALKDHAKTIGVAAPVAPDMLVDIIVRQHGGVFEVEPLPQEPPPSEPTRPSVPKSIVQARIITAGKMGDAKAMLDADPVAFARWFAPDWPAVYCDDANAVAFVTALGLDPAEILAPVSD